jgi:hypothetical protein
MNFDYLYPDKQDSRYKTYVRRDGRMERWSNHPLLHCDTRYGSDGVLLIVAKSGVGHQGG